MMELKILDGFIDCIGNEPKWMMRNIGGHAVNEQYSVEGLNRWARLIGHDPLSITIDDKTVRFTREQALQIKQELLAIVDELE